LTVGVETAAAAAAADCAPPVLIQLHQYCLCVSSKREGTRCRLDWREVVLSPLELEQPQLQQWQTTRR